MDVDKPEHSVLAPIEGLPRVSLVLADRGVLQLESGGVRSAATDQDVGTVQLSRGRGAQGYLAAGHIKKFFPAEVPRPLRLAPGIAVTCLVSPVGRILDRHDGREQTAAVAAACPFSLRNGCTLVFADPSIEHVKVPFYALERGQRSFPQPTRKTSTILVLPGSRPEKRLGLGSTAGLLNAATRW